MNDPMPPSRRDWLAALLLQRGSTLSDTLTAGAARAALLPRGLRRRLRRAMPGIAALGLLLALGAGTLAFRPNVYAAGITADGVTCTLANAIKSANTDTAVGGCAAGSGADIINVTADVTLTQPAGIALDELTGLPAINSVVTIEGNGHTIKRDAAAADFRIMAVKDANLTLNNLSISDGRAEYAGGAIRILTSTVDLNEVTISNNYAYESGGGISTSRSTVTLTGVTLTGNTAASYGGGINQYRGRLTLNDSDLTGNTSDAGGAIYDNEGLLTISGGMISENDASYGNGGGLFLSYYSVVTLDDVVLANNSAGLAGAIYSGMSTLTIDASTITGNMAADSGGLYAYAGYVTINDSTISDNTALYNGGGLSLYATPYGSALTINRSLISGNSAEYGGGIYNAGVVFEGLTLVNSTLSDNTAVYGGGMVNGGTVELINVTMTGNTATESGGGLLNTYGLATLERSLISGNSAATGGSELQVDDGVVSSNGGNVFSHASLTTATALLGFVPDAADFDASSDAGNILLANILNQTAADNGGPTLTHALVPGSPAIDRSPSAGCLLLPVDAVDQRGLPRPIDGNGVPSNDECDTGAFEFNPVNPTATPSATVTPTPTATLEPSLTPTATTTPDGSITPTATSTATGTVTPTVTVTPTESPTPSPTVSVTVTSTPESDAVFVPLVLAPEP